ncbi:MAG: Cof-type HAD-IIB family hydrolase [Firmicutes bacterium]|nr:Cof-type HAD-IIB family hydrolase [Bacillota bacterium]
MSKFIFIDVDGTLVNSKQGVSTKTIDALKAAREAGHKLVVCTGRPVNNIQEIACHDLFDYFIFANGAGIYDNKNEMVLFERAVSKKEILRAYSCIDHEDVVTFFISGNHRYVDKDFESKDKIAQTDTYISAPETFIRNNKILQMIFFSKSLDKMLDLKSYIDGRKKVKYAALSIPTQNEDKATQGVMFIDMVDRKCSKGYGIEKFCKMFKINKSETIGIGDGFNDIPMFETVGQSVAMGNANDDVKGKANFVTKSCDEDGIAHFILTELFKKA